MAVIDQLEKIASYEINISKRLQSIEDRIRLIDKMLSSLILKKTFGKISQSSYQYEVNVLNMLKSEFVLLRLILINVRMLKKGENNHV